MNHSLNILLVGGESAGVQTLRMLAASPHRIIGVVAPSLGNGDDGLWTAAEQLGLECFPADQVRLPEFAALVADRDTDVLLNVHSLHLIPTAVLTACRVGAFNLHPGPLPEYAGLNVPSWAIYNGETRHGVTLHHMVEQIDAGLVAYQSRFDIKPADTGLRVMRNCVRLGLQLIQTLLRDLAIDPESVPRVRQDLNLRKYYDRRPPNDGWLDWNRYACDIVNHVRAADYSPFPAPWGHPVCCYGPEQIAVISTASTGRFCFLTPGTVGSRSGRGVLVSTRDEWIEVQLVEKNGQCCRAADVLRTGQRLTTTSEKSRRLYQVTNVK